MSQRGLDVRILGDLSRAPPAVREAAASVEATSARMVRKCGRLNIMFSYTGTDELSRALARRRCLQQPDAARDCNCASCSVVAHASALSPQAAPVREAGVAAVEHLGGTQSHSKLTRRNGPANGVLHARVRTAVNRERQHAKACSPGLQNGAAAPNSTNASRCTRQRQHESTAARDDEQVRCSCAGARLDTHVCTEHRDGLFREIDSQLYTTDSPPVDVLMRTSGESRLSDYMVWQCRQAQLAWVADLWPALSFSTFVRCVRDWQRRRLDLTEIHERLRDAEICGRSHPDTVKT